MRINPNQRKTNYSTFAIPLILAVLFLIFLIKILFSGGATNTNVSNEGFVNVEAGQEKSELNIYMREGSSPTLITGTEKLYPTDYKLSVVSGEGKISIEGTETKIYANKLGEIKYNGKNGDENRFKILNGDIWLEGKSKTNFELKNFTINSSSAVLSFSQNMVASSVYVLKGDALVILNDGSKDPKTATIGVGQKLSVLNNDLTDTSFKMEEKIEPIDDFFKQSDFFNKHSGGAYLNNTAVDSSTGTGNTDSTLSGSIITKGGKAIIITYPEDEATIEDSKLNIEGKISSSNVEKVTLNDKEASIDKENKTFIAKDFELTSSVNNIVYKAYDSSNNLIAKGVLTIYTSSKDKQKDDEIKKPTVTTYPIASKDFKIVEPAENPYKTTDDIVKIAGVVNKGAVKFITINDFRLTKFSQFASTWYYFANKDYGTMNDGINLYTIKYYGKDDELLFTSLFTIVKESKEAPKLDNSNDKENGTGSITNG